MRIEEGEKSTAHLTAKVVHLWHDPTPAVVGAHIQLPRPDGIDRQQAVDLPSSVVETLGHEIDATGFWSLKGPDPRENADGADIVLEVVEGGRYHVIDRNCPGPPLMEVAEHIAKIAAFDLQLLDCD